MPTAPIDSIGPAGDYVYEADRAYLEQDGTLVSVSLHEDYSYSTDGGYWADP